ncbi:MAG TPA: BON domain-containing protein, partial [Verrucomicrobiae bacterium]|nr:BON domain-containing protein [Verrucomicrobiae bacterium]
MQNISKRFILAAGLAASVAVTGLTGCHTEDRTAGNYMDDRIVAHRVASNLNHDPVYKFDDVRVNVFQGVAQLSGFVDTQAQIRIAADRAARTEGVREVI